MGNAYAKGTHVSVVLDRDRFYPGELVTGTVHLNLVEPAEYESVDVKIQGTEVTRIQQDGVVKNVDTHLHRIKQLGNGNGSAAGHGPTDVRTRTRDVQTVFYKDSQQVHRWQPKEVVQPGHYQWRFAGFQLPVGTKPSSAFEPIDRTPGAPGMGNSVRSSVSYQIKAVVRRPGFSSNMRFPTPFTVLQGAVPMVTPAQVLQQPQAVPAPGVEYAAPQPQPQTQYPGQPYVQPQPHGQPQPYAQPQVYTQPQPYGQPQSNGQPQPYTQQQPQPLGYYQSPPAPAGGPQPTALSAPQQAPAI